MMAGMRVKLHLIAAPWPFLVVPSHSIGALKAFIDRAFAGRGVECLSYSAFLNILHSYKGPLAPKFQEAMAGNGENVYLYLYYKRYLSSTVKVSDRDRRKFIEKLMPHVDEGVNKLLPREDESSHFFLDEREFECLEKSTTDYIDTFLAPQLDDDALNVLGFTLNYNQVLPSIFMARYLEEVRPKAPKLLVFGGGSVVLPRTVELFNRLGIDGYLVIGEGESKLTALVEELLSQKTPGKWLSKAPQGVLRISEKPDLFERDERNFAGEIQDLGTLPDPDYREYFAALEKIKSEDPLFGRVIQPRISIEGSRGCFAKCDFCSMQAQWNGFRKQSVPDIYKRVVSMAAEYGVRGVLFSDLVCDAWAERFAEQMLATGKRMQMFMFLRAHHPEKFWTTLALAGVDVVTVGTESLSDGLLARMTKGASVAQNILAQKYLRELQIISNSNLISHHPKSTFEDIAESRRVLESISHFDDFTVARFWLSAGSPLFESIPVDQRRDLNAKPLASSAVPEALAAFATGYGYSLADQHALPAKLIEAWDEFVSWCRERARAIKTQNPTMTVARQPDGNLVILDRRFNGEGKRTQLSGVRARIYDFCHAGPKTRFLAESLNLSLDEVVEHVSWLIAQGLLLEVGGQLISLALRPKAELLHKIQDQRRTLYSHSARC